MPTFDTPRPIAATVELLVGDARITASDRPDTVVEVRPSDPGKDADIRAAELTRVEFSDGRLLVKTPKTRATLGLFTKHGSVDVDIALPTGSALHADASVASFHCAGTLGETWIKTSAGDVRLQRTGPLTAHSATGAIVADEVDGDASATTASGTIRLGRVSGGAVLKNSNGESRIGTVGGNLRAKAANGNIDVERARGSVDAATAYGAVRIGAVHSGTVSVKTSYGELEVGIARGTAAYLDLHTQFGKVVNELDNGSGPAQGEQTVEVKAHSSFGSIVVRRAPEELR